MIAVIIAVYVLGFVADVADTHNANSRATTGNALVLAVVWPLSLVVSAYCALRGLLRRAAG